jgi:choline dehydrogenase
MLPAHKRLERDLDFGEAPYHGDAGPISVKRFAVEEMGIAHQAFLEAAWSAGYPRCDDANDPDGWGAGAQPLNKLGRVRISTAVGYLAPARIRENLRIEAETGVQRLLVEGGRAVGVEVRSGGEVREIRAGLVVLCAGSIQSPGVLLRSGIGPREDLELLGIEVQRSVQGVGAHLLDHPMVPIVCGVRGEAIADPESALIQSALRYTCEGSDVRNDLMLEQITFAEPRDGQPTFGILAVLQDARSHGQVRLPSADPDAKPVIAQNMLSDPSDLSRLAKCVRDGLDLLQREPLAGLITGVLSPDPRFPVDGEGLEDFCRRAALSAYHPCGTVRMGPQSDAGAVVDHEGRCYAVEQLLVADASIMPTVPRANIHLSTIAIGEQIGERIRTRPEIFGL